MTGELKLLRGGNPMKPSSLARMELVERIRWLVWELGSQAKLAREAGVSTRQVKRWVAGDQNPKEVNARAMAVVAEKISGHPTPWELFTLDKELRQVSLKQLDEKLDKILELLDQLPKRRSR